MPAAQFFERGPSKGALQSQLIGQGLGQVGGQIAGQQYRGSQLSDAFNKVRQQAADENASPLSNLLNTLEAFRHIPGSEKYVGQITPTLMQALTAEQYKSPKSPYGQPTGDQVPRETVTSNDVMRTQGKNLANQIRETSPEGQFQSAKGPLTEPNQRVFGGVLPRIIPTEEADERARKAVESTGNPAMYQQTINDLNSLNTMAREQIQEAENKLVSVGVSEKDLPIAMKLGEEFSNLDDVNKWAGLVKQKYDRFQNYRNNLQNADVPGFWRGMLMSRQGREKELSKLQDISKGYINMGLESELRDDLAKFGLSPTEVEEQVHQLTDKQKQALNSFSPVPYKQERRPETGFTPEPQIAMPERLINQKLDKFFEDNITPNTALSVLRSDLVNEKGVPWELVGPSIRRAVANKGIKLSQDQEMEMNEISTVPPRADLNYILRDWWRVFEKIKGAK